MPRTLKNARAIVVALFVVCSAVAAHAEGWTESFADAQAQAQKTGKPILADFTGSDWCIWCKRLDKEVFSKEEFTTWAAEHVILLKLDFPQSKPQTAETKQQNHRLAKKYKIDGYPTVLLLDADGKVLGQTGYEKGGPKPWIANVEKMIPAPAKN
ncbi:MAG: thioredoxin fold domain-containing protein [Planctomycetes bacterium]|nr:thioredoxin fold domain-containing protein [Planctomycetota bacterium]